MDLLYCSWVLHGIACIDGVSGSGEDFFGWPQSPTAKIVYYPSFQCNHLRSSLRTEFSLRYRHRGKKVTTLVNFKTPLVVYRVSLQVSESCRLTTEPSILNKPYITPLLLLRP